MKRRPIIHTVVLIAVATVVGLLLYSLIRMRRNDYQFLSNRMADRSRNSFEVLRPCPLCKSMLKRGETVHSVVYSGDGSQARGAAPADARRAQAAPADTREAHARADARAHAHGDATADETSQAAEPSRSARRSRSAPDAMAHLFGCRYCYPANAEHPRICPVCGREVSADGYVVARMFERRDRKHIHVLGCTECRGAAFRRAASGRAHE